MAKRFKLRISRVMTSLQTCRSKDPSTLPSDPVPSFLRLSPPTHLLHVDSLPPKPHRRSSSSSFKRHVSSAFTSAACALRSTKNSSANPHTEPPPEFKWRKEDKWHVVAKNHNVVVDDDTPRQKIYNSSASGHSSDDLFPPAAQKKLRTKQKKKTAGGGVRLRLSTSSAETGLFSSEAEEETLVSTSRSIFSTSTDSSASVSRRRPIKTKKKKKSRGSGGESSPARLSSVFKRMIPCGALEGKVRESYAVVKRSEDPKEDFKRSMVEMVVEKQLFEEGELEQLLQCFLSLNSRNHQGAIVEAFTEIWEALFSSTTTTSSRRVSYAADKTLVGIST